jgi:hypothetical protein
MKKLIIFFLSISYFAVAQSTILNPKAVVLPQYAGAAAVTAAIPSPATGMLVYNSSLSKLMTFDSPSSSWVNVLSSKHIDNVAGEVFRIRNENLTALSTGILAETNSVSGGRAIYGKASFPIPSGDTYGLVGENLSLNGYGYGVYGLHNGNGTGVAGRSTLGGAGVIGVSASGIGVSASSETNIGVYGSSYSGIGAYFTSTTGPSLVTADGAVGLGLSFPLSVTLNAPERLDLNGRLRIRHFTQSSGIWFNNTANTITDTDGGFFGMQVPTPGAEKAGIFVGGQWNLTVDRLGNTCVRGIVQSNGACTPSDFRYKKNINPLHNALSNILKLNGVSYLYRKDEFPDQRFSDKNQIGFIAQDVEALYPEMVFTDEKGYKSVDYAKLTPVLGEAIKEQQSRIEKLEVLVLKTEQMARDMATLKSMLTTQNTK